MKEMQFSAADWWMMGILVSIALGAIGYFLKRTMTQVDAHDKDINLIKQTYASQEEVDTHEKDINEIKRTYVTEDKFNELRKEIKADLDKVSKSVDALKECALPKQDFYRAHSVVCEDTKRIYDILLKSQGGTHSE